MALLLLPGSSFGKDFIWYCESGEASAAQKRTVEALAEVVNLGPKASCKDIHARLKEKRFINIADQRISDLAPLAEFRQLESLNLAYNELTSATELDNLPELDQLIISHNRLTEMPKLVSSRKLTLLNVGFNPIATIGDLSHLAQLKKLQIDATAIDDFSAITNESLREITMRFLTGSPDLATLPALRDLRTLSLDESFALADLTSLARFSQLRELSCRYCGITNASGISGLANLRILVLEGNSITAISGGQLPASLTSLDLSANPIADFAFLSQLAKLSWTLNLDNTGLRDWRQIAPHLPNLRYLYAAFTALEEIVIDGNPNWPMLTILDLGGTAIRSLAPLQEVTAPELANFYGPDFEYVDEDKCPTRNVPKAVAEFCRFQNRQPAHESVPLRKDAN